MSEAATKSVYSVDAFSDPVVVRVDGRACFQNSSALHDFITERVKAGKRRFVIDFQQCASMDSTFLGVLAGAAIELRKLARDASLVVTRVSPRNMELMRNLGLHRLLIIDAADSVNVPKCDTALEARRCTEIENARLVLAAHENLVSADETNRAKFQDVLTFLRTRVEQG